jgi:hypothetical protein
VVALRFKASACRRAAASVINSPLMKPEQKVAHRLCPKSFERSRLR